MPDNTQKAITKKQLNAFAQTAAGLLSDFAKAASNDINDVDNAKQDKIKRVSVTIPTTGWNADSNAYYPKYYDISAQGVTADDMVTVNIAVNSIDTAAGCGMCSTNETMANKIRIRAKNVPTAAISAEYIIQKGAV